MSINVAVLLNAIVLTACAQLTSVTPSSSAGQAAESESEDAQKANTDAADALPTIASFVEESVAVPGFFDLYQEKDAGSVYLRIPIDQLDQELIYTATITDGVVETGLFRGQYRDNKILKLQRHFNRIEIVQPNTRFYFDPDSPLSRAEEANAPAAVLAVMDIVAQDTADDAGQS